MLVFGIDIPIVEILFGVLVISLILMIQSIVLVYVLLKKIKQIDKLNNNSFEDNNIKNKSNDI